MGEPVKWFSFFIISINIVMITYTLSINYMNTELVYGDLQNVVSNCRWTLSATDDFDPPNSFSVSRTTTFDQPDPENFIPYDELTEDIVKGWVYSSTSYIDAQVSVRNKIFQLETSNTKTLPLPWA